MIGAFRSSRQRNVTQDQIHTVHESPILKNHLLIRTFRYVRQDHQDKLSNNSILLPASTEYTLLWSTQENNQRDSTHISYPHFSHIRDFNTYEQRRT